MNQHLQSCQVCQDEFEKYKQKQFAIKILIPKPHIDNEMKETFEIEVSDIFKAYDLNEKDFQKKQIKSKILAIDSVGSSIVKHMTSPKFLYVYGAGVAIYFLLKKLINAN